MPGSFCHSRSGRIGFHKVVHWCWRGKVVNGLDLCQTQERSGSDSGGINREISFEYRFSKRLDDS